MLLGRFHRFKQSGIAGDVTTDEAIAWRTVICGISH
jgi:hypothetical protein